MGAAAARMQVWIEFGIRIWKGVLIDQGGAGLAEIDHHLDDRFVGVTAIDPEAIVGGAKGDLGIRIGLELGMKDLGI